MRKAIILIWLLAATQMMAQEKSTVTVKGSELNNGVILLTIHQASTSSQPAASFTLQCTKDMPDCAATKPGTYTMVRVPKNYGMYDCANVDLYPDGADPATSDKIGEYCLNEK